MDVIIGVVILLIIVVIVSSFIKILFLGLSKIRRRKKANDLSNKIAEIQQEIIKGEGRASLSVLDATDHSYRLVGKEKLLAVQNELKRYEYKSTGRYSQSRVSISVPIVKGVRYRVGSGSITTSKDWQNTDTGRLLVTDKALVFEGDSRFDRWIWGQIAEVKYTPNGYEIYKRRGNPIQLRAQNAAPQACAMIDILLRRIG